MSVDKNYQPTYTKYMVNSNIMVLRKREGRGKFLTPLLVIHSFIALLFLLVFGGGLFQLGNLTNITKIPIYTLIISLAIITLVIITAPLIWRWKKWGIYGLILLFFVWLVEYYYYELPKYLTYALHTHRLTFIIIFQTLWPFLAFFFLYFWALKRKWHLFT